MNKPITEKDFLPLISYASEESNVAIALGGTHENKATACYELAVKMAIDYSSFKKEYQRIESYNVRTEKYLLGGIFSWIGASDDQIMAAYRKGELPEKREFPFKISEKVSTNKGDGLVNFDYLSDGYILMPCSVTDDFGKGCGVPLRLTRRVIKHLEVKKKE